MQFTSHHMWCLVLELLNLSNIASCLILYLPILISQKKKLKVLQTQGAKIFSSQGKAENPRAEQKIINTIANYHVIIH